MPPEEVMPSGYDEEERYFHEHDVELLKKKRQELDAARQTRQTQASKETHWMKCPKCGADMEEIEMSSVMVDRCPGCEGLYFDKGEVELLMASKAGFMSNIRKLFGGEP